MSQEFYFQWEYSTGGSEKLSWQEPFPSVLNQKSVYKIYKYWLKFGRLF